MRNASGLQESQQDDDGLDDRSALLQFVATRDVPCPACGYNLRMLSKPACPECGLQLELTVGSQESFKRAWAIALCLSAMIAGVGVIFLLIGFVAGESPPGGALTWFWFFGPMLLMPSPAVLFLLRRRYCTMPAGIQWFIAGLLAVMLVSVGVTMVMSL